MFTTLYAGIRRSQTHTYARSLKKEQEVRGLKKIGDAFRKLVIVDGVQPLYTDEFGISYVGLIDFMLNKDILVHST